MPCIEVFGSTGGVDADDDAVMLLLVNNVACAGGRIAVSVGITRPDDDELINNVACAGGRIAVSVGMTGGEAIDEVEAGGG